MMKVSDKPGRLSKMTTPVTRTRWINSCGRIRELNTGAKSSSIVQCSPMDSKHQRVDTRVVSTNRSHKQKQKLCTCVVHLSVYISMPFSLWQRLELTLWAPDDKFSILSLNIQQCYQLFYFWKVDTHFPCRANWSNRKIIAIKGFFLNNVLAAVDVILGLKI